MQIVIKQLMKKGQNTVGISRCYKQKERAQLPEFYKNKL